MLITDTIGIHHLNAQGVYQYIEAISDMSLGSKHDSWAFKTLIPQVIETHAQYLLTNAQMGAGDILRTFFVEDMATVYTDHIHDMLTCLINEIAFDTGEHFYDVRFDHYAVSLVIRTTQSRRIEDYSDE